MNPLCQTLGRQASAEASESLGCLRFDLGSTRKVGAPRSMSLVILDQDRGGTTARVPSSCPQNRSRDRKKPCEYSKSMREAKSLLFEELSCRCSPCTILQKEGGSNPALSATLRLPDTQTWEYVQSPSSARFLTPAMVNLNQ